MSDTPQVLLTHYLNSWIADPPARILQASSRANVRRKTSTNPRYLLRLAELEMIEREPWTIERRHQGGALSGGHESG